MIRVENSLHSSLSFAFQDGEIAFSPHLIRLDKSLRGLSLTFQFLDLNLFFKIGNTCESKTFSWLNVDLCFHKWFIMDL